MVPVRYLIVLSGPDPVAELVRDRLPGGEATGDLVDGAPIRQVSEGVLSLRRPDWHIHDEHLDRRLPSSLRSAGVPLVFPSRHASERAIRCFTVHPLGNPGPAEIGGAPGSLNPTAPRLMTAALRGLDEAGRSLGRPATFEATHHGPSLDIGSMFVEIGFADDPAPAPEEARAIADLLVDLMEDPRDRVAVGVGGGHYAPHFTDLARKRRWAFGHILSRHALGIVGKQMLERARDLTPGCEGFLFHRAEDARTGPAAGLAPRLSEGSAARREAGGPSAPTSPGDGSDRGVGT